MATSAPLAIGGGQDSPHCPDGLKFLGRGCVDWPPGEELASFSDARDVCESEGLAVFAPADTVHMALTAAVLEDEVNEVELFDFFWQDSILP